ncbi:MarR family winged helix-turn-helix transcriptional regulator [Rhodococcus tukisamuensis]|uniref:MarR family winged helix-turn-helix transcriptional regulator n=1 Tax=Rhodococcus tukisamuensis TaxID=168276 RepID=UPI000934D55C|nr:MarR family winged helix-turn-helix transcriptional regulator [Rhodococcus tukisamuensis]
MQHEPAGAVAAVHEELVQLVRQLMTGDRPDEGTPTFAQHSVLAYIARNSGCRATEIADVFGVHRSTVSRQVRVCVESGWVRSESGPIRNGHPLCVTDAGASVLAEADRLRRAEVDERTRSWSDDETAEFARLLHRFRLGSPTASPAPSTPPETIGDDTSA